MWTGSTLICQVSRQLFVPSIQVRRNSRTHYFNWCQTLFCPALYGPARLKFFSNSEIRWHWGEASQAVSSCLLCPLSCHIWHKHWSWAVEAVQAILACTVKALVGNSVQCVEAMQCEGLCRQQYTACRQCTVMGYVGNSMQCRQQYSV